MRNLKSEMIFQSLKTAIQMNLKSLARLNLIGTVVKRAFLDQVVKLIFLKSDDRLMVCSTCYAKLYLKKGWLNK